MKLGKLLGAGKSFFGWQESVTYRENKQVYLPKFNPGANPFTPKTAEAKPESAPELEAQPVASPSAPEVQVQMPVAAMVEKAQKAPAVSAPGPVRVTTWTEKLNPFRGSKSAKSTPAPMPNVQAELSLNAVKVVHNDLSDAEVEVVPMKSRSVARAASMPAEFPEEPVLKSF